MLGLLHMGSVVCLHHGLFHILPGRLHGGAPRRPLVRGGVTGLPGRLWRRRMENREEWSQQPRAPLTLRQLLEVLIREQLQFVFLSIDGMKLRACLLQEEGGLTSSCLFQAWAVRSDLGKAEDTDIAPFISESDLNGSASFFPLLVIGAANCCKLGQHSVFHTGQQFHKKQQIKTNNLERATKTPAVKVKVWYRIWLHSSNVCYCWWMSH